MKGNEPAHLSEDQLSDAALGEPMSPEARTHLASCTVCRAEVDEFTSAVSEFQSATRAWSESRSAAMTPLRPASISARASGVGVFAPFAWATAGVLAVGVTVPIVQHLSHEQPVRSQTAQVEEGDSPEQIARDNQLMAEVDFELTRTDIPRARIAVAEGRGGKRP